MAGDDHILCLRGEFLCFCYYITLFPSLREYKELMCSCSWSIGLISECLFDSNLANLILVLVFLRLLILAFAETL